MGSPLEAVYAAGYRELSSQLVSGNPPGRVKSLNAVTADMQMAAAEEIRKLERYMPGWRRPDRNPVYRVVRHGVGRDGRLLGPGHCGGGQAFARLPPVLPRRSSLPPRTFNPRFRRSSRTTIFLHNIKELARAWIIFPWKSPP